VVRDGNSDRSHSAALLLGSWLSKAKSEIVPVLIELLSSKNVDAQLEAIELLGAAIGPDAAPAIPALLGLLNDKEVGTHAARALREIDPEAAKRAGVE
jgi:HEAT repeat protein